MPLVAFAMGFVIFGGIGFFFAKDYIHSMVQNGTDDYEEDSGQKTRIRHEGNI
jgi:hypothetical protein